MFFTSVQSLLHATYRLIRQFNHCYLCDMPCPEYVCIVCKHDALWRNDDQVQGDILAQSWVQPRLSHLKCDHVYALDKYRYPLTWFIPVIKFHNKPHLSEWLADQWFDNRFAQLHQQPDAIVSVPLHKKRLQQRGYNQAALIAQRISERSGIKHLKGACIRTVATKRQSELKQAQREQNVVDAFTVCGADFDGIDHIAIVDDVLTTGATVNALCAAIFKEAPHLYIDVWCLGLAEA